MPFDVDLNAGPLNNCNDFRMTWKTSLRWEQAWPGETMKVRKAPKAYRPNVGNDEAPGPEATPSPVRDKESKDRGVLRTYCGASPTRSHPAVAAAGVHYGEEQQNRKQNRKGMKQSSSDPGMPVRLPTLNKAVILKAVTGGVSPHSDDEYGIQAGRRNQREKERMHNRSKSQPQRSRLPPLNSSPNAAAGPKGATLDEANQLTPSPNRSTSLGASERRAGREAARRGEGPRGPGNDNTSSIGTVETAIRRSRNQLAKATELLADSRTTLSKTAVKEKAPAVAPLAESSLSPTDAVASTDKHPALAPWAPPWHAGQLPDQPRPPTKESLLEISTTANRIIDQLNITFTDLEQRGLVPSTRSNAAIPAAKTPVSPEEQLDVEFPAGKSLRELQDELQNKDLPEVAESLGVLLATAAITSGTGDSQEVTPRRRDSEPDLSGTGGTNEPTADVSGTGGDMDVVDASAAQAALVNDRKCLLPYMEYKQNLDTSIADWKENFDNQCLSEKAIARLQGAFMRHTELFSYDLDISNLAYLLKYLGHGVTKKTAEAVRQQVKEITPYEYLDFDEFLRFMEKFLVYERSFNREMFNKADDDGSGELSILELRQVMRSLDITPLSGKMQEAVAYVDVDCSGQLDFDEFSLFLERCLCNEGFTAADVTAFEGIYKSMAELENGRMEVHCVHDALVLFYGVSYAKEAKELEHQLIDRQKKEGHRNDVPEGLSLEDLLLLGRQLREMYYKELKTAILPGDSGAQEDFADCDMDDNDMISQKELRACFKKLGYDPLLSVLDEIFCEVVDGIAGGGDGKWTPGQELDFDQFFDFMLVYRQREGFAKAEVEYLLSVFNRFDEDASGTISTLELGDIFRHLGYIVKVDEITRYVLIVDDNESHTLDFKEFLHLMRLHRMTNINDMREAFDNNSEEVKDGPDVIPCQKVMKVLQKELDYKADQISEFIAKLPPCALDFSAFIALVDQCRTHTVAKSRRMAGFTATELEKLRDSFNTFDKDHSGTISSDELHRVLEEFGWKPRTAEDRSDVMGRLEKARTGAKEAGVEESTEDGSAEVNFWEFVQLARMIQRHDETSYEEFINGLAHELNFSNHEAAEFHEVFLSWSSKSQLEDSDPEFEEGAIPLGKEHLHKDYARRLVRTLGVKFTPAKKQTFDQELDVLCGKDKDGHELHHLDFPAFLRLMRWLLETHFIDS